MHSEVNDSPRVFMSHACLQQGHFSGPTAERGPAMQQYGPVLYAFTIETTVYESVLYHSVETKQHFSPSFINVLFFHHDWFQPANKTYVFLSIMSVFSQISHKCITHGVSN